MRTFTDLAIGGDGDAGAEGFVARWAQRRFDRASSARWPGGWWVRSDVHVDYESSEVFHHDVAGWRRSRGATMPAGRAIRVQPDWVCEVLSRGDEKRDRIDKMSALHAAGVPHYWLVDDVEQLVSMHRHTPRGYLLAASASTNATVFVEPFEATPLRTNILFGLEDDEV